MVPVDTHNFLTDAQRFAGLLRSLDSAPNAAGAPARATSSRTLHGFTT